MGCGETSSPRLDRHRNGQPVSIGTALQVACAPTEALERAGHALLARQKASGGWGYNEDVPSDADSTAWILLFLRHLGCSGAAADRAASCLVRHQRGANGGVATSSEPGPIRRFMGLGRWVPCTGWCMPHTEVTAVAGRAHAALSPDRSPVEYRGCVEVRSIASTRRRQLEFLLVDVTALHDPASGGTRAAGW